MRQGRSDGVRHRAHSKPGVLANIPVIYLLEGRTVVAYSPALDICAHGEDMGDARKSFDATLKLFIREIIERGTLRKVLKEYGWKERKGVWDPPRIIRQGTHPVKVPAAA